jgi:hypothetical protein
LSGDKMPMPKSPARRRDTSLSESRSGPKRVPGLALKFVARRGLTARASGVSEALAGMAGSTGPNAQAAASSTSDAQFPVLVGSVGDAVNADTPTTTQSAPTDIDPAEHPTTSLAAA